MTLFNEFLNEMKTKNIAVIGVGVSNLPLIRLLSNYSKNIVVYDKREDLGELEEELRARGVDLVLGEDYLKSLTGDVIFRTPGLNPNNMYLQMQKEAIVTSEMEVFFDVCPCEIFAITGSDGKTTTTTLAYELLKASGYTCHLGGNIGKPLLCDTDKMKSSDMVIVELSSFQLMTMGKSAQNACVTNVTPNHLDFHSDMEEYIAAKTNVFANQQAGNRLIINLDDEVSKDFKPNDGVNVLYFSLKEEVDNGAYLKDDIIYVAGDGEKIPVMHKDEILLKGIHNVANYLAAICTTLGYVDLEDMRHVATTFTGVRHRMEYVRTFEGVKYYNDSIGTSPTRTIAGLRAFDEKIIIIAGGYDKKIPYDVIGDEIVDNVKKLVLVGATAEKIKQAVINSTKYTEGSVEMYMETDFEAAVLKAKEIASEGDIVMLSPASASFDMFPNFAARGDKFCDIVNSFK